MKTAPRSPVRIALWTLVALSALVSLLLVFVTLALPGWIASRGVTLATETLGRPVHIKQAHFQPWRLAVVIDDLRIDGQAPSQPPLFTLAKLDAALSLRSLLRGSLVVESLALTQPVLRLARVAEGRYDIDDLIQRFAAKPGVPDGDPVEFAVYNVELTDGRVFFDDRPVQRKHELAALQLALPFVSTLESDVKVTVQPHLSGRLDGVAFDSRAEALPFADDVSARLSFKLAGLDLAPLGAYVPTSLPLRLSTGQLDVDLAVDFAEQAKGPPGVKLSGQVQLRDLALTQPNGQPMLGFKRLSLPLVDVQPFKRRMGLGEILLESPSATLRPLASNKPAGKPSVAPAPSATQPWQFSLTGLQVSDGRFTVRDLTLNAIQLKLGGAAWPLKAPAQLDGSLRLDDATLTTQVKLSPELLQADAELVDLAAERLAAWLPLPAGARLAAGVSTKANFSVMNPLADGAADRAQLTLTETQISNARLSLPGAPRLLTLALARLDKASVEPATRTVSLGALTLDAPRAQLARGADGQLNIAALLPPDSAASAPAPVANPAWKLRLAALNVERGAVRWHDAAVQGGVAPVALAIEPLRLQTTALTWPAAAPVQAQLAAQLVAVGPNDQPIADSAGSLQWSGRVGLSPLSVIGSVQAAALPVHLLNAYLDPAWGLQLQRAELGLKADFNASQQAGGGWQTDLGGDVRVGPLALLQARVVDGQRVIGEDLMSWQSLQLDGVKLALAPGAPLRLAVKDAQLDDAYARLIVNEQGRFNLRDIGPAEAAAASAAASAASAAAIAKAPQPEIAVERIRVNRGLVDFNDRFVRPNYSARLSELHGSLGAFSSTSPLMAPLTVRGKVAGTGVLEIDGQLKPGSPPAMDVAANATDIELAPLSPYAAKYIGYVIERGKLSTKLRYKVEPGGQLVASNQIILNQLSLGERVDSPDATTLPVRFAVALLKDSNGVIDVDLPVSGSLNDPEFSVGGLVWKLVLNLFGKALTSPFALFSGSDAPEAAQVAFAPGGAQLGDASKLDRVAKLLVDKPGVQLMLIGWAGIAAEGQAIREQRLAQALKAETAPTAEASLKRLYEASTLPNKPKNLLGLPKDLPPEQMRGLLLGSYTVSGEALTQLAVARANAVRDALLARGAPAARVIVGAPQVCDTACDEVWRPHVELSLSAH
ncbi:MULTISPECIES: DUF748 domain-containing protein [unclassified Roseateles]|uniref:DUF748 domain-containing protein n=1 Tax=unclassified Roseateles TaxID=2626991 RepID=UPI0006FE8303|nr:MULTISPECIES: DUF748 domain-containing protein [unclassified Roseateles]KQW43599.1 hypothetical protein ASC81_17705 [Pelomonas sp. Root405]KRA71337.1 hypothetical protein ASD88_16225 [Pelomonas sp. Root662]